MELRPRFLPIPQQSFFLFGPRGTGKSTWLRHCFPNALFVDLLQPEVYRALQAQPERLVAMVRGAPDKTTVVLDEVQRILELLDVVHSLLEHRSRILNGEKEKVFASILPLTKGE